MRNNPGVFRACIFCAVLATGMPVVCAAADIEEVNVSGKTLDEALAGKMSYNFVIVSADEIIDTEGRHFSPRKIKAYLKKTKPEKKAAYIFWVADDDSIAIAKAAIEPFADYGATVFAVRKMDGKDKPPEASPAYTGEQPKNVMLVGRPNPKSHAAGDSVPDMAARPAQLRPGKLPSRVRYKFADDAEVVAAADRTAGLLLAAGSAENITGFSDALLVQPGAWKHLSGLSELSDTKSLITHVELKAGVEKLEGRFINKPEQYSVVVAKLRSLIAADGGGSVRSLSAAEMNHWWTFIGFDIEEPVFVVASKGGRYLFVVGWNRDDVSCFDELRALPGL